MAGMDCESWSMCVAPRVIAGSLIVATFCRKWWRGDDAHALDRPPRAGGSMLSASSSSPGVPMARPAVRALRLMAACVVAAAIPWGAGALALDREKALTQFVLDSWETEDGLPQNTVHGMVRTRDGFFWFGTEEGLVRFDGAAFRVYDTSNTPALRHNSIWALLADRRGTLWIGTYGGGLTEMRDGAFRTLTTKDGLPSDIIRTLREDRSGALWAGTDGGGLVRIEDGRITTFTTHE